MASIQTVLRENVFWQNSNKSSNDLSHSSIIKTFESPDLPNDLNAGIPTKLNCIYLLLKKKSYLLLNQAYNVLIFYLPLLK